MYLDQNTRIHVWIQETVDLLVTPQDQLMCGQLANVIQELHVNNPLNKTGSIASHSKHW